MFCLCLVLIIDTTSLSADLQSFWRKQYLIKCLSRETGKISLKAFPSILQQTRPVLNIQKVQKAHKSSNHNILLIILQHSSAAVVHCHCSVNCRKCEAQSNNGCTGQFLPQVQASIG